MDEIEQIYLILESILGESKQGQYDKDTTQYQFNCPQCADEKGAIDNKYNLEVSLALDKLMFHCWSCGISGTLSKLVGKYGGRTYLRQYMQLIDSLRKSKMYDINLFADNSKSEILKPVIELPKTFTKINLKTCSDYRVTKYLISRGIGQDIIDKYNIGYTTWEEQLSGWKCRIVVPSYDEYGVLNYFVGRDFLPENKNFKRIKYKNCDADKKEIVFNEHLINWDSTIYLCEGIFDSLVFDNAIPLMGKALNDEFYLYHQITKLARGKIVIALDGDTKESESLRLFELLYCDKFKDKIYHIDLGTNECPYKDFSEIYENEGKEGMINVFRQAKKYEEFDLIRTW